MARTLAPFILGLLLLAAAVHAQEATTPPADPATATDTPQQPEPVALPSQANPDGPVALPTSAIPNQPTATEVPAVTSSEGPQTISGAVTPTALPASQPAVTPTATEQPATTTTSTPNVRGGQPRLPIRRPGFPGAFPFPGFYGLPYYNYFGYPYGRNVGPYQYAFPQNFFGANFPRGVAPTTFNGVNFAQGGIPNAVPNQGVAANVLSDPSNPGSQTVTQFARLVTAQG